MRNYNDLSTIPAYVYLRDITDRTYDFENKKQNKIIILIKKIIGLS